MRQRAYQFMVKTRCRCSNQKCRRRVTLSRHPDSYERQSFRMCSYCGSPLTVDNYRDKGKEQRRDFKSGRTCTCDATVWPHTAGSLPGCVRREEKVMQAVEDQIDAVLRGEVAPIWSDNEPPF